MKRVFWLLVAIVSTACTAGNDQTVEMAGHHHDHPQFTKHYAKSLFQVSDTGAFSVEMVLPADDFQVGENQVDLILHDRSDHDVVGAQVTVTPWMVLHGHGSPDTPEVVERGGGLYTVKNLNLTMAGPWEIRIAMDQPGGADKAVLLVGAGMKNEAVPHVHKDMPVAVENLDYSRTRTSEEGLFRVTYTPDPPQIPLNTMHTWKLMVLSEDDGKPVTGADIAIAGEMPAHGHGLPTQPRITGEPGNGEYLGEGMKFNMPGFWIVSFVIKANGRQDVVKFNLML